MFGLPTHKVIDIPPVWLLGACAFSYWVGQTFPLQSGIGGAWTSALGIGLVSTGLVLMVLALLALRNAKTTVIPHLSPNSLVTGGIFAYSRNPIYLGDVLVLLGLILHWRAALALPVLVVFIGILNFRFIGPEEHRLKSVFGEEFDEYCQKVRRWI